MKNIHKSFVFLAIASWTLGIAAPATAEPFAYVANFGSGTVSVIDTATSTVVGTVTVGSTPVGAAITPDGAFAYVANSTSGTVSVIDTATNTVMATIPVGANPEGIAFTPNGAFAYVANHGSAAPGTVSVIDTGTKTVTATVTVGDNPWGVVITPDGASAYVANTVPNTVSVIETSGNTVVATIPVGNVPRGIAITPDGASAYVGNVFSDSVSVIGTATNTVVTTVPVGGQPQGVAITPDGTRVYTVNLVTDDISVISTATNTVAATFPAAVDPRRGMAITPDGALGYLSDFGPGIVLVIDTDPMSPTFNSVVGAPIPVGSGPHGIAVTPVIGILVAPLEHDFGQVDAFTSEDAIVTISNTGGPDLEVASIAITAGASSFSITNIDPPGVPPFTLSSGEDVFVTVTFSPTSGGVHNGTLTVDSDDSDEPTVDVSLIGNGLADVLETQATALEGAVDEAIAFGELVGSGSGNSAEGRLNAFANMIEAAGDLIEAGLFEDACGQLRSAIRRVDGDSKPPDFVEGVAAETIESEIMALRDSLGCS